MAAKQGLSAQLTQTADDARRSILNRAPPSIKSHSWLSNLNTTCTIKSAPPRTPEVMSLLSTKSGWLVKRNEQHVWQRRWCCVVPHTFLYYFDAEPLLDDTSGDAGGENSGTVGGSSLAQACGGGLDQDALNAAVRDGYGHGEGKRRAGGLYNLTRYSGYGSGAETPSYNIAVPAESTCGGTGGGGGGAGGGDLPSTAASANLQPVGIIDLECYTTINRASTNDRILELTGDAITNPDLRSFYFQGEDAETCEQWTKALLSDRHSALRDEREAYRQVCDGFGAQLQHCSDLIDDAENKTKEMERECYTVRSAAEDVRRGVVNVVRESLERGPWGPGTSQRNGRGGLNSGRNSRGRSVHQEEQDERVTKIEALRRTYLTELDTILNNPQNAATMAGGAIPSVKLLSNYTVALQTSYADLAGELSTLKFKLDETADIDKATLEELRAKMDAMQRQHESERAKDAERITELESLTTEKSREVEDVNHQLQSQRMEFVMYQNKTKTKVNELVQHKKILKKEVIDLRKKIDELGSENNLLLHKAESLGRGVSMERERNSVLERYVEKIEGQVRVQQNMMEMMSQGGGGSVMGQVVGPAASVSGMGEDTGSFQGGINNFPSGASHSSLPFSSSPPQMVRRSSSNQLGGGFGDYAPPSPLPCYPRDGGGVGGQTNKSEMKLPKSGVDRNGAGPAHGDSPTSTQLPPEEALNPPDSALPPLAISSNVLIGDGDDEFANAGGGHDESDGENDDSVADHRQQSSSAVEVEMKTDDGGIRSIVPDRSSCEHTNRDHDDMTPSKEEVNETHARQQQQQQKQQDQANSTVVSAKSTSRSKGNISRRRAKYLRAVDARRASSKRSAETDASHAQPCSPRQANHPALPPPQQQEQQQKQQQQQQQLTCPESPSTMPVTSPPPVMLSPKAASDAQAGGVLDASDLYVRENNEMLQRAKDYIQRNDSRETSLSPVQRPHVPGVADVDSFMDRDQVSDDEDDGDDKSHVSELTEDRTQKQFEEAETFARRHQSGVIMRGFGAGMGGRGTSRSEINGNSSGRRPPSEGAELPSVIGVNGGGLEQSTIPQGFGAANQISNSRPPRVSHPSPSFSAQQVAGVISRHQSFKVSNDENSVSMSSTGSYGSALASERGGEQRRLSVAQRARLDADAAPATPVRVTPPPLARNDSTGSLQSLRKGQHTREDLSSHGRVSARDPSPSKSVRSASTTTSNSFFSKFGKSLTNAIDNSVLGVKDPSNDETDENDSEELSEEKKMMKQHKQETMTSLEQRQQIQREKQIAFLKQQGLLTDEASLRGGAGATPVGTPKRTFGPGADGDGASLASTTTSLSLSFRGSAGTHNSIGTR